MVLLVYLLGRLGGPVVGLLAALLAAIYPAFIDNSEQILSEPIAAFTLSAAALGSCGRAIQALGLGVARSPGAMLGATALAREYLMFALFLGLIVLVRTARRRDVRVGCWRRRCSWPRSAWCRHLDAAQLPGARSVRPCHHRW